MSTATDTVWATYTAPPPMVRAAQLTRDTADSILRWTNGYRLGPDRWIAGECCWRVSALRWYPATTLRDAPVVAAALHARQALIVGLRTKAGERYALAGDWIVQFGGGEFKVVHPDAFRDLYSPSERGLGV
jgi:hypothetical protein